MPTKFLKVNRKVVFIFAFTICMSAVWAGDERSIRDFRDALVALGPNVDPRTPPRAVSLANIVSF